MSGDEIRPVPVTRHHDDGQRIARVAGLALALGVSAWLMAVAMQSQTGWWLGWVTLLPLMLAIRVLPPLRALAAGAFWGMGFYVFSLAGPQTPFAPSLEAFALLTAIPGLYAGAGSVVTRRVGFSPLLLGLGWVGVEFALHPLALHNGLLAGAVGDGLFMRVIGNVAGYVLVAFLVAYVTASLLSVLGQVCTRNGSLRRVLGNGSAAPKRYSREITFDLRNYIRPLRPRAPPA